MAGVTGCAGGYRPPMRQNCDAPGQDKGYRLYYYGDQIKDEMGGAPSMYRIEKKCGGLWWETWRKETICEDSTEMKENMKMKREET
jgi:hypothetical protein